MKVYLKYSFIFEPPMEWRNRDDFDQDLGLYFKSKGFISEVIKTALDSEHDEERILYLTKLETVFPEVSQENTPTIESSKSPPKQNTPRQIINNLLIKKRDETGRFQKEK